jgi:hypothetical protein
VGRQLLPSVAVAICLLTSSVASADDLLNLELSGGAGVTAYNERVDSALAPPFLQLQLSYLPLEVGPLSMGPLFGVPLGFYRPRGQEEGPLSTVQIGLRAGWQVYGRPSVDFAWSATAAVDFVLSPLDDEEDPLDFVWGLELGGSVAYFLTAGLALTAGLRYAFFYGVDPAHVFSGQLGVLISYEVLR